MMFGRSPFVLCRFVASSLSNFRHMDRREHSGAGIDFQDTQGVNVILVPFDERAVRHGSFPMGKHPQQAAVFAKPLRGGRKTRVRNRLPAKRCDLCGFRPPALKSSWKRNAWCLFKRHCFEQGKTGIPTSRTADRAIGNDLCGDAGMIAY
jgi:hypothetical protein